MGARPQLTGMTKTDLDYFLEGEGIDPKYSVAIATNFYRRGIRRFENFANIPGSVRALLNSKLSAGLFEPVTSEISSDKTVKYLFRSTDGREFETVFIPDGKRKTVCVSTQAGCRMGCPFCLTGRYGFRGNLSTGEIINQILSIPEADSITHIVFMGMGEPLDNIDEVLRSCKILTSEWGLAVSPRNITVSTVGITAGVKRFLAESDCNLTLSLFSPFPAERASVVPAEKANPVSEIIGIMKDFRLRKRRRLTIAYVMINGINDTEGHLRELKTLLSGTGIRVNLLPYHPIGDDEYISSDISLMEHFKNVLMMSGISASVRRSRGSDISAACGLLASGLKK